MATLTRKRGITEQHGERMEKLTGALTKKFFVENTALQVDWSAKVDQIWYIETRYTCETVSNYIFSHGWPYCADY